MNLNWRQHSYTYRNQEIVCNEFSFKKDVLGPLPRRDPYGRPFPSLDRGIEPKQQVTQASYGLSNRNNLPLRLCFCFVIAEGICIKAKSSSPFELKNPAIQSTIPSCAREAWWVSKTIIRWFLGGCRSPNGVTFGLFCSLLIITPENLKLEKFSNDDSSFQHTCTTYETLMHSYFYSVNICTPYWRSMTILQIDIPNRSVAVKSAIPSKFTSIHCVACLQIMYFDILVDIFVCQTRAYQ